MREKNEKLVKDDSEKYAREKQGINQEPNMPVGVKKPKNTSK